MNNSQVIKEIKELFFEETSIDLDFRSHAYLSNDYGNYPQCEYDFAKIFIDVVNRYFDKYDCRIYNTQADIESLKTQTFKQFIEHNVECVRSCY